MKNFWIACALLLFTATSFWFFRKSSTSPQLNLEEQNWVGNSDPILDSIEEHIPESAPPASVQTGFHENESGLLNSSFPKLEQLKNILGDDDTQHTPDLLIQAGETIGLVEEHMKNPEFFQEGLKFFDQCILDGELPAVIRALCYFQLKEKSPDHPSLGNPQIPSEVIEAAESLE